MCNQVMATDFKSVSCTVCQGRAHQLLFQIPPRIIIKCKDCGHEFVYSFVSKPEFSFLPWEEDSPETKIDLHYLEKIFSKYNVVKGKLLDLGCGYGRLEKGLIESGWDQENLYLMEVSESCIDVVKKKYPSAHFILGDGEKDIGFDDYFECILMVELLEHVVNPRTVMTNVLKALKTNGLLIIRALPNNKSFEAYVGKDKWRMRLFEQHHHFFNPDTFSIFVKEFPSIQILEFGCFLQEGFHFYNIQRIARNIGIVKDPISNDRYKNQDDVVPNSELTDLVLNKLKGINFDSYPYKERIPISQLYRLSSTKEVEAFFDKIHLDYRLSPDFSVVIRKVNGY